MVTVVTPPAVRCAVEQTYNAVNVVNVLWLKVDPEPSVPAELDDLAESVYSAWQGDVLPHQADPLTLTGVKVLYYGPAGEYSGEFNASTSGSAGGTPVPQDVATVVSWHIGRTYRGGHPRSYLAGNITSQLQDQRTWNSTYLAAILGAMENFRTAINALTTADFSTITLGTMSRSTGGAPRADTLFEPYTGVSIQERVCSQRRRLGALV